MKKHACLIFMIMGLLSLVSPSIHSQINLEDTVIRLDDIMVIGYATGSRATISGAVDKITEPDMNKSPVLTPLDAIRERIAGVIITPANNGPAVLSSVRIRGTTSLTGGNDPLIIVDGVFGNINTLNSIFPADIESFTILKDASETAQYGSRGASGVIEIATKKGTNQPLTVTYYRSMGIEHVAHNLNMLSGNEYRLLARKQGVEFIDLGNNTNFIREMTHPGLVHNHHLAVGSGTSNSNYRVSLGWTDREGVVRNNHSRNFTLKADIRQTALEGRLAVDFGLFGSLLKNNYLFDFQKTFYSAAAFNPTFSKHRNKETGAWDQLSYASQIANPLAWLTVDDDEDNAHINVHGKINFS